MEITKIHYRNFADHRQEYSGYWTAVEGGIVLLLSENSQYFVPNHKIDGIEQTFSNSVPKQERYNKSLHTRFRK